MNDFNMTGDLLMVMLALTIAGGVTALVLPMYNRRKGDLPDAVGAAVAAFVTTAIVLCLREVYLPRGQHSGRGKEEAPAVAKANAALNRPPRTAGAN